jgi:putative transposase
MHDMSVSTQQFIGLLGEAVAGLPINEPYRRHGFSEASYYLWCSELGGMS